MNDQGLIGARVEVIGVGEAVLLATVRSVIGRCLLIENGDGFLIAIDLDHVAVRMVRDQDVSNGVDACRNDLEMALGYAHGAPGTTADWRELIKRVGNLVRNLKSEAAGIRADRRAELNAACGVERDLTWSELTDHVKQMAAETDGIRLMLAAVPGEITLAAVQRTLAVATGKLEVQGKSMHTIMDQLDVTTERWRKIDSERNEVRAILRAADTESTEKAAQRVKEDAVGCDSFRIERDHAWDELHKVLGMIGDHPRGVTRAIDAVKRVIAERDSANMELEAVECALKRSDAQVVELLGLIADASVRANKAVAILHENMVGPDR